MTVTARLGLLDKMQTVGAFASGDNVIRLIAGMDDEANVLDACVYRFVDQNLQCGFSFAMTINDCLQRQPALVFAGCGDYSFGDFHD
jgi:hypothetical protein